MPSYILSEPYKQRVDHALSVVEGQPSQGNVTTIPTRFETLPQPGVAKAYRICTFEGSWPVHTSKPVLPKDAESSDSAFPAINLFFPITASSTVTRHCAVAKEGTAWYLVAVPMVERTAVFSTSNEVVTVLSAGSTSTAAMVSSAGTQTVTLLTGAITQSVSFVSTASATLVTGVQASLDTDTCSIGITLSTATVKIVSSASKIDIVTSVTSHTQTFVTSIISQSATMISAGGTQTINVAGATVSATYLSFGVNFPGMQI